MSYRVVINLVRIPWLIARSPKVILELNIYL